MWLHAEATTVDEAESRCFAWFERFRECAAQERGHDWTRTDPNNSHDPERRDGYAWCRGCGAGGLVLLPLDVCVACGAPTSANAFDDRGNPFCVEDYWLVPDAGLGYGARRVRQTLREMEDARDSGEVTDSDIQSALPDMIRALINRLPSP